MRKYRLLASRFLEVVFLSFLLLSGCASEEQRPHVEEQIQVWDNVEGLTGVKVRILARNLGSVFSLDISPDGKNLIAGSSRGIVKIWDLKTGVEKLSLNQCLRPGVEQVAFSPDGRSFVAVGHNCGTYDQKVKLCDSKTGSELVKLDDSKEYCTVATFSEDGKYLVGLDDITGGIIRIWKIKNGKLMMSFPNKAPCPLSFVARSPNGKWFFTGKSIRNLLSGDKARKLHGWPGRCLWFVTFSPDGSLTAWRHPSGQIKLRDTKDGSEIKSISAHVGRICSTAFSPSGERIASAGVDKTIKIWDLPEGLEIMTLRGHEDMVFSVLFSPDGRRIFSSSRDGTIRVWAIGM